MTPLAHTLVARQTLPVRKRDWFLDRCGLLSRMEDIHCFDLTAVEDLMWEYVERIHGRPINEISHLLFLPARRTWLETVLDGRRFAHYVDSAQDENVWDFTLVLANGARRYCWLVRDGEGFRPQWDETCDAQSFEKINKLFARLVSSLVMINTPRIIGRRIHMPHAGLQKALAKSRGMTGKFPLHAWTEIKLEVHPPKQADNDEPQEAYLTGARALHFCRAHLRIRNGQLEYVRSHWRGDPSIGIKRSRYKLVMPQG